MDEILKKLLESELLSEETRVELSEQFKTATQSLREELALEVRAELVEQWTEQRDTLIQSVDEKVTEMLSDEMVELKEDISRFRDLEVEYAEKLVTEKHKLAETLGDELDQLVDKLDAFLDYRLTEEMTELKEDLDLQRQNKFGRKIFEAYMSEFNKSFVDEDSVQRQLTVAESKLQDAETKLYDLERQKKVAQREQTMEAVLKPLIGSKREQMQMILQNVETHKLQEAYNMFVGRILKEDAKTTEPKVVVEDVEPTKVVKKKTTVVTGDRNPVVEDKVDNRQSELLKETLRLAGVTK